MLFSPAASDRATGWRLVPEADIETGDGGPVATSPEPWLRLVQAGGPALRRWVRLRYSASHFDDPIRPLIRFSGREGQTLVQPMNGPVLGSAEWTGRVPEGTETIAISPVARAGRFDFRIDSVEPVARRQLVRRGLAYNPGALMLSFGAKFINAQEERWETLKFASSATPLDDYHAWHGRLARPVEPDGLDRPRTDWSRAPAAHLFMALGTDSPKALGATLASLSEQVHRRWTLHALASAPTPPALLAAFHEAASRDARLRLLAEDTPMAALASDMTAQDMALAITPGDRLPDHALAVLAETLVREPTARLVYGDEDSIAADGRLHSPRFKPDWSPTWFRSESYPGRPAALRCADLAGIGLTASAFADQQDDAVRTVAERTAARDIVHIRRILYRRRREAADPAPAAAATPSRWPARTAILAGNALPEATIVIPTRDRADLLGRCMATLREHTDYPAYRIVVVDNGSVRPKSVRLLRELGALPQVQVIARPGPFNYSALCNDGARLTDTPLLVFLNNDVTVFEPGWLKALAGWAVQPDVGAVGAKLLFPGDTLEHAGVVLGLGGIAGHIHEGRPAAEPGHMNRLLAPHEVSGVTGACIAIERAKFEAVGGFDAANLPVDLNDIDLCLKAAERGWRTIWTPEAALYHRQSATRGYPLKPFTLYRKERDHFRQRWAHVIRDDPFFHPGLSLFSYEPALA